MNGNYDPSKPNTRRPVGAPGDKRPQQRPAPSAHGGQPPRVNRPQNGRGPTPSQPLRPQQRRGESAVRPAPGKGTKSTPVKTPDPKEKKTNRNIILAAVLLILVIITIIIFGIQSCARQEENEYNNDDDNVILNTTKPSAPDKNSVPVYAEYKDDKKLNIESGYGILIDLDSNRVIASKDGEKKIYPASMTKVMTLIVAYESISDLDKTTYTFDAAMLDELFLANASVAGFLANETVTARDLLYGAILPSGGDATNALAELVGGSEEQFADMMNAKVKELGLKNTHFVTASGLHHDDHYSTCHDMAKILEYAISKPEMRKILSTYQYTTSATEQHPEGILLTSTLFSRMAGDEVAGLFVQGGKTGYTLEAKNCLCTFAANCREEEASYTEPQYILVTAFAGSNEYAPVFDAINVYKEYCAS